MHRLYRVLADLQAAFSGFLCWALYIDVTQDKNRWYGTVLLVAAVLLTAVSSCALRRVPDKEAG